MTTIIIPIKNTINKNLLYILYTFVKLSKKKLIDEPEATCIER